MYLHLIAATLMSLSAGPATAAPPRGHRHPTGSDSTSATVQNDESQPVTVYADLANEEILLGTVPAFDSETFSLPAWWAADGRSIDFMVHPEEGFDQDTGDLMLERGDHIGIVVPGKTAPAPAAAEETWGSPDSTTATIENDRKGPVTVYLDRGSSEIRLGEVPAGSAQTFAVPKWWVTGSTTVDFFVHPENGFDEDTGLVTMYPGEHLAIEVPAR